MSLAATLLPRVASRPPNMDKSFYSHLSFFRIIYQLPLQVQKAILDACRIQQPILSNQTLASIFHEFPLIYHIAVNSRGHPVTRVRDEYSTIPYPTADIISEVDFWTKSSPGASLLAYFVRAEQLADQILFEENTLGAFIKEFQATQQGSRPPVLDYSRIFKLKDTGYILEKSIARIGD